MLLIDTHILVWMIDRPNMLRVVERAVLDANADELAASVISLWELRLKWERLDRAGRRKGPLDPVDVRQALAILGIPILPLDAEQAVASLRVPIKHRDPFDEQLLIHAQVIGAKLITRDANLIAHPLAYRFG
ncbi:type II toxin-antitoxin system VapC family toxin [Sphingomonas sp. MMS12-HWE2-04]|uniref:type II toxin-antitoxin system VapC family toxin n=1 Tax=Sphingomonas sp. MMS12-HWE2-04 TaxID=3234199 RepID=UPI0038510C4C